LHCIPTDIDTEQLMMAMSRAGSRTWLAVVLVSATVRLSTTGLLDWGRSDRLQVNIPWLPCK